MTSAEVVVLRFGARRVPRALADLPLYDVASAEDVDAAGGRRVIVLGTHADLSVVLTRLLRSDRLDVEVGFPSSARHARRARTGQARRVPLIRDETGTVITSAALWLPTEGNARTIEGEAVVDDTVLFDGEVAGRVHRTDRGDARPAGARDGTGMAALGHRAGGPARHHRRTGDARRCRCPAAGQAIDVLSAHDGLAGRSVT